MGSLRSPSRWSYEVAFPGELSPASLAMVATLGVERAVTSSVFLLSVPHGLGLGEVTSMLQRRGLEILDIRKVGATHG